MAAPFPLLVALWLAALPAAAQAPRRVVSINLCTDQLLIALADPGQIAAVSRWAQRPDMSFLAQQAAKLPTIHGRAEDVLKLKPDLVLAGTFSNTATRALLREKGLRVEDFAPPRKLAEAKAEIERAAALLGQAKRGAALIAGIDDSSTRAFTAGPTALSALALQRRGYASGPDTMLADMMQNVGLTNAAEKLGIATVERASLEAILKARPDALVIDDTGPRATDQGAALLRHPALLRAVPPDRWIRLPAALTSCAGPAVPAALELLSRGAHSIQTRMPQ